MRKVLGVGVIALGLVGAASAQQIATRAQLDQILSTGFDYTDAFEEYSVASGTAAFLATPTLNSLTVVNGQGPGLVDPGVTYTGANSGASFQWDGANYFGSNSQEILALQPEIAFNYTTAIDAMGVDLRGFAGFGDTYTADVYNGATLVGTFTGTLANDGSSTFFGWENAGGITAVDFFSGVQSWSPIVDNHSYGDAVITPEPASVAALALGGLALLRRRRRA